MSEADGLTEEPLGPREALLNIQTLADAGLQIEDIGVVHKLLSEILTLTNKALPPRRMGPRYKPRRADEAEAGIGS